MNDGQGAGTFGSLLITRNIIFDPIQFFPGVLDAGVPPGANEHAEDANGWVLYYDENGWLS